MTDPGHPGPDVDPDDLEPPSREPSPTAKLKPPPREPEPAYLELVGREVDVLHTYDPDRGGDGMVVFRGVLLEVTDRGLTIDGDDRDDLLDEEKMTRAYRSLIPWSGFLRVEAVDSHPV